MRICTVCHTEMNPLEDRVRWVLSESGRSLEATHYPVCPGPKADYHDQADLKPAPRLPGGASRLGL